MSLIHQSYLKNVDKESELYGIHDKTADKNFACNYQSQTNNLDDFFKTSYISYNNVDKVSGNLHNVKHHTVCQSVNKINQPQGETLNNRTRNNVNDDNRLVMGRLPRYHQSEKIWSNNTKRKNISNHYLF